MLKRYLLIILIPTAAIIAKPGTGPGLKRMAMDDDLQLSKEQREQLAEIRTIKQKQMIDLRADLEKLQLDLREQLRADKPDRKAIDATLAEINAQRGVVQKLRVEQHLQVREMLTPEQREIFDRRPIGGRRFDMGRGQRDRGHRPGRIRHRW